MPKVRKVVLRKKNQNPFWMTIYTADAENWEEMLGTALREMLFYGIFLIILTILAIGTMFPSMYYLTRALQELFLDHEFPTAEGDEMVFKDITTPSDFWSYVDTVLFHGFQWQSWYLPIENNSTVNPKYLYENKLLGVPRLRQLRVQNNTCDIYYEFDKIFNSCYGKLSSSTESTSPFGLGKGTAWTYNSEKDTGSMSYNGFISDYAGGGYYQNLERNRKASRDIISNLKDNLWIGRATRCVFIELTVYNPNLNLFSIVKIVFEFPATGGIIPSSRFHTLKLINHVTSWDYFIVACQFLFIVFIIFYSIEEGIEYQQLDGKYFKIGWSYLDILILVLGYAYLILFLIQHLSTKIALMEYLEVTDKYASFEHPAYLQLYVDCLIALLMFLAYINCFKYLTLISSTTGQLNKTLSKCATDVLAFLVTFLIIFSGYAVVGYLLFGSKVEEYRNFGMSMFTLLRTILGNFDYIKIENANPVFAPIFFVSYIFLIFFILLNMFLAIINDAYYDVKTDLSSGPKQITLLRFLKRAFKKIAIKCNCVKWFSQEKDSSNDYDETIEAIRDALKKCAFNDLEIDMFFARYNIDPTASVGEFDVNKLMADLERMPETRPATSVVTVDEFMGQQQRLSEIEKTLKQFHLKVDTLLKKIDYVENIRKQ